MSPISLLCSVLAGAYLFVGLLLAIFRGRGSFKTRILILFGWPLYLSLQ